jgi:hypothetical protein
MKRKRGNKAKADDKPPKKVAKKMSDTKRAKVVDIFEQAEPRFRFYLNPVESNEIGSSVMCYYMESENRNFHKRQNNWNVCFVSNEPMTRDVNYFELTLWNYGLPKNKGIYVGVVDTNKPNFQVEKTTDRICAMDDSKLKVKMSLGVVKEELIQVKHGDTIGVVVDKIKDEILFYHNGKLVGRNKEDRKPSSFKEMYVFCTAFPNKFGQGVSEVYNYFDLSKE